MVGRWWFVLLVALIVSGSASACNDAGRIEFVCEKFCACETPSPALQDRCTDECIADLAGFALPDECIDCVALNECRDIEAACAAPCQVAVPRMSMADEENNDETID